MDNTFQQIVDKLVELAIRNLKNDKSLMPVAILFKGSQMHKIIGMQFSGMDEKQAIANAINQTVQQDAIDTVIFIMETWMSKIENNDTKALDHAREHGISDRPDKTEAIVIQVASIGENIIYVIPFERKENEIATGQTETMSNTSILESRWTDGLWGTNKTLH